MVIFPKIIYRMRDTVFKEFICIICFLAIFDEFG